MDAAIVMSAQDGDELAFAHITQLVGGQLNRIAFSILRDRDSAQDATQQALIDIWRKLPTLKDPARFEPWAYRIVVRRCYREAKRGRRLVPELFGERSALADDDLVSVDDRDQIERAFVRLTVDQRAVVVLHHYVGLPMREVADVLGIAEGTAHSRLGRAMERLRIALGADEGKRPVVQREVTG